MITRETLENALERGVSPSQLARELGLNGCSAVNNAERKHQLRLPRAKTSGPRQTWWKVLANGEEVEISAPNAETAALEGVRRVIGNLHGETEVAVTRNGATSRHRVEVTTIRVQARAV